MQKLALALLAAHLGAAMAAAAGDAPPSAVMPRVPIVNGVVSSDFPSVVALIDPASGALICTGTLIGCQTVLTAAHCVCQSDGAGCQDPGGDLLDPTGIQVFSQHGGFFDVASVSVAPAFEFGAASDVAVLRLAAPVNGVAPTPINTLEDPAPGSAGTIVGFGVSRGDFDDAGLKRRGRVETAACGAVPGESNLCWLFTSPLGAPGDDSNTCVGDSGGPLFLDLGSGSTVAGVSSGGSTSSCLPDDEAWNTNVFNDRVWILAEGGPDLENAVCGDLPQAGSAAAPISSVTGTLDGETPERRYTLEVPAGAKKLRVALNGEDGSIFLPNDFDLFVRAAEAPTTESFDCSSRLEGGFEFCDIEAPAAGTWHVLASIFDGVGGEFQLTATVIAEAAGTGACTPGTTTLCIDDEPGDGRFEITVDYATALNGGSTGQGKAIPLSPLGIRRGGLFWFFDITNPELLIKVLDGCDINGNYWVFWSAGTTVGLELEVRDLHTGQTVTYLDPDGTTAKPVTDTFALPCE